MSNKRSYEDFNNVPPSPSPSIDLEIVPSKKSRLSPPNSETNDTGLFKRFVAGGLGGLTTSFGTMVRNVFPFKPRSEMRTQKSTVNKSKLLTKGARSVSDDGSTGTLAALLAHDEKEMKQIVGSSTTILVDKPESGDAGPSSPRQASTSPYPTPQSSQDPLGSNGSLSKASSTTSVASDAPTDIYLFSEGKLQAGRPEDEREVSPTGGSASQPIEVGDSDTEDEDEPSAPPTPRSVKIDVPSPRTPLVRPPPSRPNLSGHTPIAKEYSWMNDGASLSSHGSDRKRKRNSMARSNLRTPQYRQKERERHYARKLQQAVEDGTPEGKARLERIERTILQTESPGRYAEMLWKIESKDQADPTRSKDVFAALLAERSSLQDPLTPRTKSDYSLTRLHNRVSAVKKDALLHRPSSVQDLREKFEKTQLEEEEKIKKKLRPACPTRMRGDRKKAVSRHLNNESFKQGTVDSSSLIRLCGIEWLNDEIINNYLELVEKRMKERPGEMMNVHCFNTFFYTRLISGGYAGVRRWSKRFDMFSKDLVLIPVNISGMHWTAAAINLRAKRFEYYDSMAGASTARKILANLRSYLEQEHQDKKKSSIDLSSWTDYFSSSTPQQNNGSDCGVFTSQTLESLSRGKDLTRSEEWEFGAVNMPYIRDLMVYEIAQQKLEPRWPQED